MRRHWALLLVTANLVGLLALVFIYPDLMVSPGPLVSAHADLATDCFACHAPLRGAAPERCIACHAVADIGLRTTKGTPVVRQSPRTLFHQDLIEQDCMACHSDHPAARLVPRAEASFSHALLRPAIRDRCETCHAAAMPRNDIHRDLSAGCAQCHSANGWKPATFDHAKLFVLDRDHNAPCVTCHVNNVFSSYTCYGCHEHQPDRVRAKHLKEGIRDFENCVSCHRSAHGKPERGDRRGRREHD